MNKYIFEIMTASIFLVISIIVGIAFDPSLGTVIAVINFYFIIFQINVKRNIVPTLDDIKDSTESMRASLINGSLADYYFLLDNNAKLKLENIDDIYNMNIEALKRLSVNQTYFATHPSAENRGDESQSPLNMVSYRSYVREQMKASDRGVDVRRIYIFDDLNNISDDYKRHLRELCSSKVKVSIIDARKLVPKRNEDFIIISDDVLGQSSINENGIMDGSIYLFHQSNHRREFEEYQRYFNNLWENSTKLTRNNAFLR